MKREKFIPTYVEKKRSLILLFILVGIYLYSCSKGFSFIDNETDRNLIKPLMWGFLIFVVWKMPRLKGKAMKRFRGSVNLWAFIFGVIYILSLMGIGLIMGLGKNPLGGSIKANTSLFCMFGIPLIGREIVRSYLIANTRNKYKWIAILGTAILMAFIKEDISKYLKLGSLQSTAMFFGNYGMENVSTSMMASYLAYLGGAIPALIYMSIVVGFGFFSPILPDLQWLVKALVSTIVPLFSFMIMQEIYSKESREMEYRMENKKTKKESTVGWLATVLIAIGIIWFAVGVFPIYPLVIATGSMEPMIKPGDVVLYRKLDNDTVKKLKKDDIINFKRDGITITHRIIEVQEIDEMRCYLTQGDNNSTDDGTPVQMNDIKGKYVNVIPKIGWPTLLLKQDDDVKKEDVEF